jgi:hypothetical protein
MPYKIRWSREKPLFLAPSHPKLCESTFLGASLMEPFYFTPFGTKQLQIAPEATGEAMPNGTLIRPFIKPLRLGLYHNSQVVIWGL